MEITIKTSKEECLVSFDENEIWGFTVRIVRRGDMWVGVDYPHDGYEKLSDAINFVLKFQGGL